MNTEADSGRLTPSEEKDLISRAQRGCQVSARQLIAAHQDRLHAFIWRMVRNDHDAEEICQDAFLRAFQSLEKFDFQYRFSTWLFTIGYRICLNLLRKRKDFSGDMDFSIVETDGRSRVETDVYEEVANSDEARRLKDLIWESVEDLTPQQRATVLLFYKEGMSCQDIGSVLEIPAATVKSHLHRARARLKGMLERHLVEDWSQVRFGTSG